MTKKHKTEEIEIIVSGGRNAKTFISNPDFNETLNLTVTVQKVEASELSFKDKFMKHKPRTEAEREFKDLVKDAIKKGLKDFWRPKNDPSIWYSKIQINAFISLSYMPGNYPATLPWLTYDWWENFAREYAPEYKSRLGTKTEYIAFLAVLIKRMVNQGWKVKDAWNEVCNNSKDLGHYRNSQNFTLNYELTGSREICGFCDLGNTRKILSDDETTEYCLAGGWYCSHGENLPLAKIENQFGRYDMTHGSLGWIIFEHCYYKRT